MVDEDHDLKAALELHAAINGLRRGRREPSHGHEKALEMVRQKRAKTETHDSGSKGSIAGNQASASVKSEHQQQQQQPKKDRRPSEGRKQRQKTEGGHNTEAHQKGAPSTSGKDAQEARPPTMDVSQQHEQQAASAPPSTALEDAAHAAGAAIQLRVKQQGVHCEDDAARRIKCFMAGIRWGINLAPDSLSSRSDLATALNDALAGEILSCGRGDMLNVAMLDREGNTSEFPPLKSGTRECSSQWKFSVTNSARIYVRRGQ
ncbi:hypothetical protein DUNSADRAFT_15919 [Dunaliella salina]|uniref:Uncharacterized protein n=1 Tax=Dunaliella salina TaxID=3046 RepID=A0ABQ7H1E6_DUNSA|nr:hypothetical protein DUNSADRAFT_15919 [Dunaliella salina]|eukprot:KAF5840676.1 hypothetical protein DUNSADRAFT_15919 [Dunaliella salina]